MLNALGPRVKAAIATIFTDDHAGTRYGAAQVLGRFLAVRARGVRAHAVRLGAASLRRAADVHQDAAAASRRRPGGLVGGDRRVPGGAARGLCLRTCACADTASGAGRLCPSRAARGRFGGAAEATASSARWTK